jgi:two-component system, NarL family, sensor histidine kinase DevS
MGLLRRALEQTILASGANGAYVTVDAPPLPSFEVGVGELSGGRPGGAGAGRMATEIQVGGREGVVGTLWVSGPDMASTVACEAVVAALEAGWAVAEARVTADRLEALDAATRAIVAELELDRVLQLIVDNVRPLVRARYAALGIVDAAGRIERFITSGITPSERARVGAPPVGRGLLGLIIREGRSYRIRDIATHPDSAGLPPNHPPMHSFLGVPIRVGTQTVGNLYLTEKAGGGGFSAIDERLVESFALHAGIAIQNARLHLRVQQLAVVEDRERIGKDLHDGIIQEVYAVSLSLEDVAELMKDDPQEASARVERAIDSLHHTIRDIRSFIFELEPDLLAGASLVSGAAELIEEFRHNTAIEADLRVREVRAEPAPSATREVLAILIEALSNVARHAQAHAVQVDLDGRQGGLLLTVTDDGVGLPDGGQDLLGHQGLRNMRARAARLGGTLAIAPAPRRGTRVSLWVGHDQLADQDAMEGRT